MLKKQIFISSVQKEFSKERRALKNYIQGDVLLSRFFDVFLFEYHSEAIVNAVAHRDYTSNGSVQVMLFADRLEIWNPGTLPPSLTIEKLRKPHGSVPHNPLIAESLYLTKYIEKMGTGIRDIISRCKTAGLPEPEFLLSDGFVTIIRRKALLNIKKNKDEVTGQVTGQVSDEILRLLSVINGEMTRQELQEKLLLKSRANFEERYLKPALKSGLIEYTIPGKPNSRMQKYRITARGSQIVKQRKK